MRLGQVLAEQSQQVGAKRPAKARNRLGGLGPTILDVAAPHRCRLTEQLLSLVAPAIGFGTCISG
jgi:hypothetical protein